MAEIDLGAELESAIDRLVESGRFTSEAEVLREGVRMVEEREAELDRAIEAGLADARAGRVQPAEEVFARLLTKYKRMIDAAE